MSRKIKMIKGKSILTITILILIALSSYQLDKSLWFDESTAVYDAKESIYKIIFEPTWSDQVPFYRIVLHFWIKMFGDNEIVVRIPSIIFGIFSMIILYKLTALLFNKKTASVSLILFATNILFLQYNQESRKYTLFILLSLLSMYFLLKSLKKGTNINWFLLSITTIVNIFTHFMSLFIILIQATFFFFYIKKYKRHLKKLIVISLIVFIIILSHLINMSSYVSFRQDTHENMEGITGDGFISYVKIILLSFSNNNIIISLVFLLLSIIGFISIYDNKKELFTLSLLWITIPIILLYISKNVIYDIQVRHLIFLLPIFIMLVSYGILFFKGKIKLFILVFILAISIFSLNDYYNRPHPDWTNAVNYINNNFQKGDMIIVTWWSEPLLDYYSNLEKNNIKKINPTSINSKQLWVIYRKYYPTWTEAQDFIRKVKLRYSSSEDKHYQGEIVIKVLSQ